MDNQHVQNLLEQVPFFNGFSEAQLESLSQAGSLQEQPADTALFYEGDPASELFLILEGSVKVLAKNPEGQEIELATMQAGQFFGELALADGGARSASVKTVSPCRFFVLSRDQFIQQLARSPQLLSEVIASISSKIRRANTQYFEEQIQKQNEKIRLEHQRQQSISQMIHRIVDEFHSPLEKMQSMAMGMEQDLMTIQHLPVATRLGRTREQVQHNIARLFLLVQSFKSILPTDIYAQRERVQWSAFWPEFESMYRSSSFRQLPLRIQLHPDAAARPWLGYPHLLMEILMHLVNNIETHAYPEGNQPIAIELKLHPEGTGFILKVCDKGQGIEARLLNQVRDPFFTTRRDLGFMGLGLAVASNLTETALDGQLALASQPQKGTCVRIDFPFEAHKPQLD